MSTQHTPGLWTTDEAAHDAPYQDIKIKAGKHHTVCTVWIDDAPVRDFNAAQRANARLIAAAPDLLEKLDHLVQCCEALNIVGPDVDEAREAIAKATEAT
jgi:hypothetical protein